MAGSTIIDIAYGLDIRYSDLKRAEECLQIIVQAGNPGAYLVDILPHVRLTIPSLLVFSTHPR